MLLEYHKSDQISCVIFLEQPDIVCINAGCKQGACGETSAFHHAR